MTNEARSAANPPSAVGSSRALLATAALTVLAGLVGAGVAAGLEGSAAARAVVVGTVLTVAVLLLGAIGLDMVAGVMPSASLLAALLTYTLQLLVLLAAFVAVERSGLLGDVLDRDWLGGAVIVATLAWIAGQLRMFLRARVPAFDVPVDSPRLSGREGGH